MPWSSSEAKSHTKKATTPAKKKKWASIANGVRKSSGGDDGKAIRIANASVADRFWKGNLFLSDKFKKYLKDNVATLSPKQNIVRAKDDDGDDDCPDCGGSGMQDGNECPACGGSGKDQSDDDDDDNMEDALRTDGGPGSGPQPGQKVRLNQPGHTYHGKLATVLGAHPTSANYTRVQFMDPHDQSKEGYVNAAIKTSNLKVTDSVNDDNDGDCPDCDGTGIDENGDECETCGGTGNVSMEDGDEDEGDDMSDSARRKKTIDGRTVIRMYDRIKLDDTSKVRFLDNGYISAMPRIARTGIQVYGGSECGRDDMDIVRVYRPESEVFSVDAAHTYTHLPLTLDHPTVQVNSKNWKKYAVGETGDEVLRDGSAVRVPMMLRDADAIKAFKEGTNQLSVGYDCDLEWVNGVTDDGHKFDAIQHGIRANHLAIVTAARGGSTLSIGDDDEDLNFDDHRGERNMNDRMLNVKTILVDGLEVQVVDTAAAVIQRTISGLELKLQTLNDEFKKKVKEGEDDDEDSAKKDAALKTKDEEIKARDKTIEAKDGEISVLKKQLADAVKAASPEAVDAAARERAGVIDKANTIMGARLKTDGMTVAEIRRNVVDSKIGNCKDWSDDRVGGAFDAMQANAFSTDRRSPGGQTIDDAVRVFGGKPGMGYQTPQEARDRSYQDYDTSISEAWRTPTRTV